MSRRLALWDRLAAALVGIGPPTADVETAPAHALAARGDLVHAVGDVASRYFDIDGRPVAFENEKLLLAVSRDQLRNAGTVIAVAGGAAKGPVDRRGGARGADPRPGHGRRRGAGSARLRARGSERRDGLGFHA